MKNYPIIAVVGTSGSGKSRSIKNLDPETTVILNIENKSLPFQGASKFTRNIEISDSNQIDLEIDKALKDSTVKTIVLESLSAYCDKLITKAKVALHITGWDIYNYHNDKLTNTIDKLKNNAGKFIIVIAIDEVVKMMSSSGVESSQRRILVEGKKHVGKVEYHFPIVLFTQTSKEDKDKPTKYFFATNGDGLITAKSPENMFPQLIPNDLKLVIDRIKEYYEIQ